MFQRRNPKPFWERVRNQMWPVMGVSRWAVYWWHRMCRIMASPHQIALGVACGVAISFTPLIGFHVICSLILAWLVRGNYVAAAIGTLIGNPVTLPIFLAWQFWLSQELIGPSSQDLLFSLNWADVQENPWMMAQSWVHTVLYGLIGAAPLFFISGVISYWASLKLVVRYKMAKSHKASLAAQSTKMDT